MSLLASFIAALERTGGERLVLRSGEPPHLLVGETRRDLGTASVSSKALTALTAQILSAEAQRTFAETDAADEPLTLTGAVSASSLFVEARRSGSDTSITLRRVLPQPAAVSEEPALPSVALPPAPAEPVVAPAKPTENVPEPEEWEPVDLAAPSLKVEAVVESKSDPLPEPVAVSLAAEPMGIVALAEPPPEPTRSIAETVPTCIAELTRTGGDRLVFRSGERPHLLVGEVRHDLDTATVSNKAMNEIVSLILSAGAQRTFVDTNGAVEPLGGTVSTSPLLVEARRTGNEICIELRRCLTPESDAAVLMPTTPVRPALIPFSAPPPLVEPIAIPAEPTKRVSEADEPSAWDPIGIPAAEFAIADVPEPEPSLVAAEPMGVVAFSEPPPEPTAVSLAAEPMGVVALPEPPPELTAVPLAAEPMGVVALPEPPPELTAVPLAAEPMGVVALPEPAPEPAAVSLAAEPMGVVALPEPPPELTAVRLAAEPMGVVALPEPAPEPTAVSLAAEPMEVAAIPEPAPEPAAVPVAAGRWRIVPTPPQEPKAVVADAAPANIAVANRGDTNVLEYWIRLAARREATAMYLRAGQAVVVRVREQVVPLNLDGVDRAFIERVTAGFAAHDDDWRSADGEWVREYDGVGEVRCLTFTDEVGPGLVVHLSAQHSASTLQRYIPRQVRRSCEEDDGIVLVSAETTADVLAMVAAVAQWTAQRRAGYVISVEPPHGLGHDVTGTFVSARRIDGSADDVAAAIRRATHERPDILVIALPSGVGAEEAIRAARPGCLIIIGVVASTGPRALESLLSTVNPRAEPQMRRSLAAELRCGFSYRALRRIGGGRTIVHDALVATREVRAGLNQGDFGALDKLQRSGAGGMRSLDTALARAVHRREISLRQATMHAVDCGEVISLVRQASRERVRMSREHPGVLRAVAGASGTQPL